MDGMESVLLADSTPQSSRRRLANWCTEKIGSLRPGPRAWRGAVVGAVAAGATLVTLFTTTFRSGFGTLMDLMLGLSASLVVILLMRFVVAVFVALVRSVPNRVAISIVSAILTALFIPLLTGNANPLLLLFVLVILLEALTGMSLAAFASGELAGASRFKRALVSGLLLLTLAANGVMIFWLSGSGSDAHLTKVEPPVGGNSAPIKAANPAEPGPYNVELLFYGSGRDKHRPEFGPGTDLKTEPVDGTLLLPDWKGFSAQVRQWYWGFDAHQLPLNGRVWYPQGAGPFPLVLIVHGNHAMAQYSDPGYAYLGELLASRGYITVSVSENFLNYSWSGNLGGNELPARAWLLLQHLKVWRAWNEQVGNPFYHKVALDQIALIGHSRGGEAVAIAAVFNQLSSYPDDARLKFDFHFGIKSVIALSPSVDYYAPAGQPVTLDHVNYLVLQGGHDSDIAVFVGSRQYHRVKFTDQEYRFKALLYIYRANHVQFNTRWGGSDWSEPLSALLNRKPLLPAEEQRQIAKVYIAAFLAATLRGEQAYLPLFRDQRAAAAWLPDTVYLSQFRDSAFKMVSNYEEDVDVTTTTVPGGAQTGERLSVWREEKLQLRLDNESNQANNVVRLAWEKDEAGPAFYRITLPDQLAAHWQLAAGTRLSFGVANASESREPVEILLELTTADGASVRLPLRRFVTLTPPLTIRLAKWPALESWLSKPAELVLQTIELPLRDFAQANPQFEPAKLKTITFWFERRQAGAVVLDGIGFSPMTLN